MQEKSSMNVDSGTLENPETLSRESLITVCCCQRKFIDELLEVNNSDKTALLGKQEIMLIYGCEADKALRILKVMFQMGFAVKIGKGYHTTREKHKEFVEIMLGKTVQI